MTEQFSPDEERDLITHLPTNPDGFRRLYRHYFPRIYAYAACRVSSRLDAEDIVANIFVSVIEAVGRFEYRGDGSFAAWLFRIAHNEIQQHYRGLQRQNLMPLQEDIHSHEMPPDEVIMQQERYARLQAMLRTLSPRRQEIISLRYFGELRNHEIAAVLGLSEKTVASHLARGLDDLQRKYRQKDMQP